MTTTIDTEIKIRLQELLATKEQTTGKLVRQKASGCYFCIEGLIALAIGGVAYEYREEIFINGEHLVYELTTKNFKGISNHVSRELLIQNAVFLELSSSQLEYLKNYRVAAVAWVHLNDTVGFTFPQFSKLLDLI